MKKILITQIRNELDKIFKSDESREVDVSINKTLCPPGSKLTAMERYIGDGCTCTIHRKDIVDNIRLMDQNESGLIEKGVRETVRVALICSYNSYSPIRGFHPMDVISMYIKESYSGFNYKIK